MAPKYPSIPEPTIKPESLRDAVLTLKQAFEVLTGQRGNANYAALLPEDVVSLTNSVADNTADIAAVDAAKVAKAGDTMTGHLTLPTTPAAANAVRKDYVDTADALKVAKAGDSMSGSLLPSVNGTLNLGSATFRWATVYTSDLSLNNGIGDWTIVEGEDDLFLYNNKKNRVYKFALIEAERGLVPPKK